MEQAEEIARRLAAVPDPVALLAGLFAFAPVGFQVYRADGHVLLTNAAFRELFGSEPPPEYNVLEDEIAEQQGILALIRRAFAGQTVSTPTIWYDPRQLRQVSVKEGRRIAMSTTIFPLRDAAGQITHVAIVVRDDTRETLAAERAAALLRVASALSEATTFPEVAHAIPLQAQAAAKAEDAVLLAFAEARDSFPGGFPKAVTIAPGRATLPLVAGGRALAVLQLSLPPGGELSDEERDWLATLARICAEAYERALIVDARARDAEAAADRAGFLADASAALGASLDLAATLQTACDLCVPRLGDFAVIDVLREGAPERQASAADAGVRAALLEWPPVAGVALSPLAAFQAGAPQIANGLGDADLVAGATSPQHLAQLRRVRPRSVMHCALVVRGTAIAALGVGRLGDQAYGPAEAQLLQDLAGRAALAIDSARQHAEAKGAVRLRDDFLSIAGHELRTPLTALQLQVQAMRRRLARPELPPDLLGLRQAGEVAERQVRRLTGLVQQLLDVSRLQAGRFELDLEELELGELLREVAGRFETGADQPPIAVRLDGELRGRWDRMRLDQVITNLLSNALRYGAGKPIELALVRSGAAALISVRDHGIGIAPQDQLRIFERFERAAPVRNYGGVGLGLWIVHQLVAAMGGEVSVHSKPGEGATFSVKLPL